MELVLEILKAVAYGIIEGITEWLPVSSTGHMILAEQVLKFNLSDEFMEMFRVVIQLGAIMAVVVLSFFRPDRGEMDKKLLLKTARGQIIKMVSDAAGCSPISMKTCSGHLSTTSSASAVPNGIINTAGLPSTCPSRKSSRRTLP